MTKMVGLQNPANMLTKCKGLRFCEAQLPRSMLIRGLDRGGGKRAVSWADACDAEQGER